MPESAPHLWRRQDCPVIFDARLFATWPGMTRLSTEGAGFAPQPLLPPVSRGEAGWSDVARLRGRFCRAEGFASSGRHAAAERLLRDVAAAASRRAAHALAAEALGALGRVLLDRGRTDDADRAFDHAIASGTRANGPDGALTANAMLWQVIVRTEAGRLKEAEASSRVVEAATARLAAAARAVRARILLRQQRIAEATTLDLRCTPVAPDDGWTPYVGAMGVRLALARGDVFAAGSAVRGLLTATAAAHARARLIAVTAQLRVLLMTGDLDLARPYLHAAIGLAREAHLPLRVIRLRVLWLEALDRAGAHGEGASLRAGLRRLGAGLPPWLRDVVVAGVRGPHPVAMTRSPHTVDLVGGADVASLLHAEPDDQIAAARVLTDLLARVRAAGAEVWLHPSDAEPAVRVGEGAAIAIRTSVFDGGLTLDGHDGRECGVPIRVGPEIVGVLAVRWTPSAGRPAGFQEALAWAACVLGPRIDVRRVARTGDAGQTMPELIGVSALIAQVRVTVLRAAAAPFAVLVQGESGTGKELVARAIHRASNRCGRRFVDVNCAALPDELLDAELFGHARTAFTGAQVDRAGLVEEAHGGTLFLDEVADLSPRAQAKLLRMLQQQEVRRVGETHNRPVDVRVVAAANRDLGQEAAEGRFRRDLLYRLDVIRIRIPPLRDRADDVPVLAEHFWAISARHVGSCARLSPAALAALGRYEWPGNVRELQNVMAALAMVAPARGRIGPGVLPLRAASEPLSATRLRDAREQFERVFITRTLARSGGRRAAAARALGVSRQGLARLLDRLGIGGTPASRGDA